MAKFHIEIEDSEIIESIIESHEDDILKAVEEAASSYFADMYPSDIVGLFDSDSLDGAAEFAVKSAFEATLETAVAENIDKIVKQIESHISMSYIHEIQKLNQQVESLAAKLAILENVCYNGIGAKVKRFLKTYINIG